MSNQAKDVYEPSETVSKHNPYDTKVGGKPACTLADGTVPNTVKQVASLADGPAATDNSEDENDSEVDVINASPAAKKLAEKNGIDLSAITGTGKDGAITKADVQGVIDAKVTE